MTERKSFTLLELIIVIFIVGILTTLGFVQYARMMEKGRKAEARNNLSLLRKLEIEYYLRNGVYSDLAGLGTSLPVNCNSANSSEHFFAYYCYYASSFAGRCMAYRCITGSGGRNPVSPFEYYEIYVNPDGSVGGIGNWE